MKLDQKILAIVGVLVLDCLVGFIVISKAISDNGIVLAETKENTILFEELTGKVDETNNTVELTKKEEQAKEIKSKIVYDGMTIDQLSAKLEKSMNSNLKGKGALFATESIKLGLDPYLAVAITLQETGCSYDCSSMVKMCNNVGGLKGKPGCNGGSYMSFSSLDEGIKSYLKILHKRYYSKGLTTPEKMNASYAASPTWASKVNWYIKKVKAA